MDNDVLDHLKSLHTAAIDARNGYEEALRDADRHSLTGLFHKMISLHSGNAAELEQQLIMSGEKTDDKGSYMSVIHRTIMSVRSLFDALDESVLPGLIDGEKRNIKHYDEALALPTIEASVCNLLVTQRERINEALAAMKEEKEHAS
jgi:uncharacterized protein (TIGR02284 family)